MLDMYLLTLGISGALGFALTVMLLGLSRTRGGITRKFQSSRDANAGPYPSRTVTAYS